MVTTNVQPIHKGFELDEETGLIHKIRRNPYVVNPYGVPDLTTHTTELNVDPDDPITTKEEPNENQ